MGTQIHYSAIVIIIINSIVHSLKKKHGCYLFPFFLHEYYIMNVRTPPRRRPFSYATTVMITVLAVFCCLGLLFWNLSNDDLSPLLLICVVWLTVCLRILVKLGNV